MMLNSAWASGWTTFHFPKCLTSLKDDDQFLSKMHVLAGNKFFLSLTTTTQFVSRAMRPFINVIEVVEKLAFT
jgi:hypothetical protein